MNSGHGTLYGRDKGVDLFLVYDQGWGDLEHHEVVAADLGEDSFVAEHAADQHLAEHGGMNLGKSFEREAQGEVRRGLELDAVQQANPGDVLHHVVRGKRL